MALRKTRTPRKRVMRVFTASSYRPSLSLQQGCSTNSVDESIQIHATGLSFPLLTGGSEVGCGDGIRATNFITVDIPAPCYRASDFYRDAARGLRKRLARGNPVPN